MTKIQTVTNAIVNQGILPLYYNDDETVTIDILKSLYKAGIQAVEYTSRGESALSNFKKMIDVRDLEMPEMLLGIGTIKNLQQAEEYYEIGADFFISPGFVAEVAAFLIPKDLLYSPGCMTPTEIITAEAAGVTFIKLFPGNALGAGFMSSIKDVFPNLKFMPTGGVDTTKENIESWFKAGVSAVGMGSKLISKDLMAAKDYSTIENETKKVLEIIQTLTK
ncbi:MULTISPECIES: bifunctional 4-hydroxy-2-oxoglutarate aldolase/2-dehydro-3-deoxy-phosphogluconate aldolase [unclassified Chryseobacterium]|uniref:bifunctional 4-hydroxy-2-oxoglutarate aldolase/2-dehydro-3-deoxy-phosphogluconate aldolase n=1 Tax=unclassified Chryseobacterium TaxID=2593645 RepID=UPI000D3436C3|nr:MULTISPECIES: bifunctional 4-hydroxy-2-oxoglutarate aldolase/2-dehydro-3-deoxy-phosphogluconate aldolase [unclassified Chryseobacterium]PTT74191.1 bifunctional 4-hydroxy-2-oxoglutarate aldolase/2-dehydro-3-deoxy-phosphogluconate aldolase [Chryseobacterium sp. HMWF001]PVV49374.1 bifunctional 4-hydroxy-2-oxoglutarate aldolase/2-dehydro-3-deoxy-phosphogluconate aldolase [Chryseobacterium sp. HMWF035]